MINNQSISSVQFNQ